MIKIQEFLELFERNRFKNNLAIDISYTKVIDWYVVIKQGNHARYKTLFEIQDCDLNFCIAKAYVFLTKWLCENQGGY